MLRVLRIENLAVVASSEIEFGSGLNLLTGETGAGKSIVVDALGLVAGERSDATMIRTGEDRGTVEAIFDAPAGFDFESLGLGIDVSEGEVAIRREITSGGRSRATINGVTVPLSVLKSVGGRLVQIHGQHQHHALLEPSVHLELLDRFGSLTERAQKAREAHAAAEGARRALEDFRNRAKDWARERDALEFQVSEIRTAALEAGEEERLREERVRLRNSERLGQLAREAFALIEEDEGAINPRMRTLCRRLDELARVDPAALPTVLARRDDVESALRDWAAEIESYVEKLDVDPRRIDEVESRLAIIERLKKKYGSSIEEILKFFDESEHKLAESDAPEHREKALAWELEQRLDSYGKLASSLSADRRVAAKKLEKALARELADLAMQACRFAVGFEPKEAGDAEDWRFRGLESAEFFLSANPGEDPKPLSAVASGGELSRTLLALQSLIDAGGRSTAVFDEVDAGIGGAVAEAVGRRLGQVARERQVLCVTHLAQVAAFAEHHYVVEKRVVRGRTLTEVREVDGRDREREIARMLAGETVSVSAEENARDLMSRARERRGGARSA